MVDRKKEALKKKKKNPGPVIHNGYKQVIKSIITVGVSFHEHQLFKGH